ncbi:hypothetical protein GRJ2_002523600 [Grus japonensis]|uniref:Uncharacterized protein n=1 Tax=Grus japonensis TaxID=30415 RepID=A0ABC9XT38_GRUJA
MKSWGCPLREPIVARARLRLTQTLSDVFHKFYRQVWPLEEIPQPVPDRGRMEIPFVKIKYSRHPSRAHNCSEKHFCPRPSRSPQPSCRQRSIPNPPLRLPALPSHTFHRQKTRGNKATKSCPRFHLTT